MVDKNGQAEMATMWTMAITKATKLFEIVYRNGQASLATKWITLSKVTILFEMAKQQRHPCELQR